MSNEILDIENYELGISPIGMVLVIVSALIGVVLFLDHNSSTYDVAVGGVIGLSITVAFSSGLQRWANQGDLRKTLKTAILGTTVISIIVTASAYAMPSGTFSVLNGNDILVLAIPAIFEELLFRAGVYLTVQRTLGTGWAIVIQSGLFALYHFARNPSPAYFVILFVGGLIFQWVFLYTRDILSSMIAHGLVNLRPLYMQILLSPATIIVAILVIVFTIFRRRSQ